MNRKQVPMNVSAADILAAHIAIFGSYDSKVSFAAMGEAIRNARPADWNQVMRNALAVREAMQAEGVEYPDYAEVAKRMAI
jgi:hypothetical protein